MEVYGLSQFASNNLAYEILKNALGVFLSTRELDGLTAVLQSRNSPVGVVDVAHKCPLMIGVSGVDIVPVLWIVTSREAQSG
jgi:hypothetical protein